MNVCSRCVLGCIWSIMYHCWHERLKAVKQWVRYGRFSTHCAVLCVAFIPLFLWCVQQQTDECVVVLLQFSLRAETCLYKETRPSGTQKLLQPLTLPVQTINLGTKTHLPPVPHTYAQREMVIYSFCFLPSKVKINYAFYPMTKEACQTLHNQTAAQWCCQ